MTLKLNFAGTSLAPCIASSSSSSRNLQRHPQANYSIRHPHAPSHQSFHTAKWGAVLIEASISQQGVIAHIKIGHEPPEMGFRVTRLSVVSFPSRASHGDDREFQDGSARWLSHHAASPGVSNASLALEPYTWRRQSGFLWPIVGSAKNLCYSCGLALEGWPSG